MPLLSDIEEVTEVTEDSKKRDGAVASTANSSFRHSVGDNSFRLSGVENIDTSLRRSIAGDDEPGCHLDTSENSPSKTSKTSRNPSVVVSIDPAMLAMISSMDDRGDSDSESEKQPHFHLFCYSCCDLIRACIITNAINIVCMLYLLLTSVFQVPGLFNFGLYKEEAYDDDEYLQIVDRTGYIAIGRTVLAIVFSAIGIVGSVTFHKWVILSVAIWFLIYIISSAIDRRWAGVAIAVFFAYPNWHLFFALLRGKISKENYASLKYCCCGDDMC